MNKQQIKQTMLSLEAHELAHARDKYLAFVADARLDRSEPIENDEQAQAELASDLSEAFDQPVHEHAEKVAALEVIDFSPKTHVERGAVVNLDGRYFVIAVSTDKFTCQGHEMMGISTQAPIYAALEGKKAGDTVSFNRRKMKIIEVF